MNTRIGILGCGGVGSALGALFQRSGYPIVYGVRDPEKVGAKIGEGAAVKSFAEAAASPVIVVAVPWTAAVALLKSLPSLEGKIIIDATNPLQADWSPLLLGEETSAAEEIQKAVPGASVVKAFNTIFADMMTVDRIAEAKAPVSAFFCGNDAGAKTVVAAMIGDVGLSPVDVGSLVCARYLEAMAHLNINIAVAMGGGTHAFFSYGQATG